MSRSRVWPPSRGPDAPAKRGAVRFTDEEAHTPAGLREAPRKKPRGDSHGHIRRAGMACARRRTRECGRVGRADAAQDGLGALGFRPPEDPRTIRIVLAGQAGPGAASRAIDEGEVYRCLTKPSNPAGLARGIQRGLRLPHLSRESSRLPSKARQQRVMPRDLGERQPGIGEIKVNDGARFFLKRSCRGPRSRIRTGERMGESEA
jgi:hypothetical protein